MQIIFERGVDNIIFGLTEAQVVALLGSPDKIAIDANDSRDLIYNHQKLVLKIEPNGRLGWIEIHNKLATWDGITPWRIEKNALLTLIGKRLNESYEFEDYGHMESYIFQITWIELQYEFGELSCINIGVPYDENDQQRWPSQQDCD
jgi:hypothetical protein